ncbi:MAG: AAA domain-containing protein [Eubacterium sp.]|nr:AAA domain-containing protein [Eubacterium sp.]
MNTDIFTYLGIADSAGRMYYHPWLVMLDEQRRMYSDISAIVNKMVYDGLIRDHASVIPKRKAIVQREPFAGKSISYINTQGMYAAAAKNNNNSRFNILSAMIAFQTALQAERSGNQSVGIITPYYGIYIRCEAGHYLKPDEI